MDCSGGETSVEKTTDSYISNLQKVMPEAQVTSGNLAIASSVLQPRRMETLKSTGHLVVIDDADKSITLINEQGKLLSEVGGEGRGPGEFQNIAQLHVGNEGRIYLLDMVIFRITIYEVVDGKLEYIEALPYKNPPNHSLHRIYVTSSGIYGVFNETEGFQSPENYFWLYRLDENFAPAEQLLKIPGHERERVDYSDFKLYMPNVLLRQTLWDVEGEWFYYLSSYEPVINKYHLKTEKSEEISVHPISRERLRRDYHIRFFKERFGIEEYKEQWDIVEEQDRLPLFSGFWVEGGKILLRMFYPAEDEGMMVYMDMGSEEVSYFNVPHEFSQLTMRDKMIYGIDFNLNEPYRLMYLDWSTK